jgi:hypothetical protein
MSMVVPDRRADLGQRGDASQGSQPDEEDKF